MRIFLDASVLVSVLNKEFPLFPHSSRVLSLTENSRFQVFTSPLCLAIAYFFAEKKSGEALAKKKLSLLSENLRITEMNEKTTRLAAKSKIDDFEDALQYYSALESKCECIVTENTKDFYKCDLDVFDCEQFLKLVVSKNQSR
jgi:predicted nucleic acid-binding protein